MSKVFVDSNIVMYAAGASHANKEPCLRCLASVQRGEVRAVTSTEVLQEFLHRYHRLGRGELGARVYGLMVQLCSQTLPVTVADTDRCVELLGTLGGSVRDCLHVAVMQNNQIDTVATFDGGFDAFGVQRWELS